MSFYDIKEEHEVFYKASLVPNSLFIHKEKPILKIVFLPPVQF